MDRCVGAAARLPESDRKDLAVQALAQSATISDPAAQHGVSRRLIYQQTHKAVAALDDAFLSAAPGHEVLFEVAVTKAWLRQVIVRLALICRSSPGRLAASRTGHPSNRNPALTGRRFPHALCNPKKGGF